MGFRPLDIAVEMGSLPVVHILLEHGASAMVNNQVNSAQIDKFNCLIPVC